MASVERWYFGLDQIHNTPSNKCGYDHDKELSCRQQAANFIQDMGQKLQVTQLCINTAIVYMHRFYMFHSFTRFQRTALASAALFLAAKVEEQPRKLEHVIRVAQMCLHREHPQIDVKSEAYNEQAQDLIMNENILLQTLGFDVAIDHPHTHIVRCCQLVRASKDLAQTSYFMASYSLHLTTMCLQYKPTVVACFCIHLACKWSNWEIPESSEGKPWFWYVDKSVTSELLEHLTTEFLSLFEKCPSRLKKKIMSLSYQHMPTPPNSQQLTPQQQQELDKRKESNRAAIESHIPPNAQHPMASMPSNMSGPHPYFHQMGGHHSGSGSSTASSSSSSLSLEDQHKKRVEQQHMSSSIRPEQAAARAEQAAARAEQAARLSGAPLPPDYKKHHHHPAHARDSYGLVPGSKSSCMFGPLQPVSSLQSQKPGFHSNNVHSSSSSSLNSNHSNNGGGIGGIGLSSSSHPVNSNNSGNLNNISNSSNNNSSSSRYHNVPGEHHPSSNSSLPNSSRVPVSRPPHFRNGDAHIPLKTFEIKAEVKSEPVERKPFAPGQAPQVVAPQNTASAPKPQKVKTPPLLPPPQIKQERSIFSPEEKAPSPPAAAAAPRPTAETPVKLPSPPPTPGSPLQVKKEPPSSGSDSEPPKPNGEPPRSDSSPSKPHKKKKKKHKEHKDKHKEKHKHKHKTKDPEPIVITIPKEKITITQPPEGLKIKIAKDKISPSSGLKIKISRDKLKESKKRERSEERDGSIEQSSKHHRPNGTTLQVDSGSRH